MWICLVAYRVHHASLYKLIPDKGQELNIYIGLQQQIVSKSIYVEGPGLRAKPKAASPSPSVLLEGTTKLYQNFASNFNGALCKTETNTL